MPETRVATARSRRRHRIDVHQHIYPPRFTKRMIDALVEDLPDYPASMYLEWSPQQSLAMMAHSGLALTTRRSPFVG